MQLKKDAIILEYKMKILCRNYSASIFGRKVKFGRLVVYFRPSGFDRLSQTLLLSIFALDQFFIADCRVLLSNNMLI